MPEADAIPSDIPDSATTARESVFQDVLLHSDGTIRKDKEEDFRIDPLERESTALDNNDEEDEENSGNDFGGDGTLEKTTSQAREWWKFRLRPPEDDEPEDWWFASMAIPLLAATLGPMANVLSIAALVTSWRERFNDHSPGVEEDAIPYPDPTWCIALNAVSLACGFLGNFFLLFNFTRAVRYIIALPVTILLWFFATGILMAITICMHLYTPPAPTEIYSQGYWHAVMASVLYCLCSIMLMINMLGYFLGHYPQHFELDDEQRNLILQTMMLFFWLAAGGGVFSKVCQWSFTDALYFCDVTIVTVGFGDFFPDNDLSRGLMFPYAVGGIIILGLVVSSIAKFAQQLGHDKVVQKHLDKRRVKTLSKTVTSSQEAEERYALEDMMRKKNKSGQRPSISGPFNPTKRTIAFEPPETPDLRSMKSPNTFRSAYSRSSTLTSPKKTLSWASSITDRITHPSRHTHHSAMSRGIKRMGTLRKVTSKTTKLRMLRDERDRFNAMRKIQYNTKKFKKYVGLSMSLIAFLLVWCLGALVFMFAERHTYFESLYFCYVSLLTIGYGDLSPKTNAGKPFFIVWSLLAIPTMTILISSMGDTIVASYKQGTFSLADLTVLPKQGYVRNLFVKYPGMLGWLEHWIEHRKERSRLEKGFPVGPEDEHESNEGVNEGPTLEELAEESRLDEHDLAHQLTAQIRSTADDLKNGHFRRYTYEEWVEFTRLIRFTQYKRSRKRSISHQLDEEEVDDGIIEWDWIGEDSPMMSDQSETEWVLDRLCESLERYMRQQVPELKKRRRHSDARSYQRRASRQASDAGFSPVEVSGANASVRRRSGQPSPRSPNLQPTAAPGPGARTPPIPGVSPYRQRRSRFPSLDGAEDLTDSDPDKDYEHNGIIYDDDFDDEKRDPNLPPPFKPRPKALDISRHASDRTYPETPPIRDSDREDPQTEGEREARTPRSSHPRPSAAILSTAVGTGTSGSSRGSSANHASNSAATARKRSQSSTNGRTSSGGQNGASSSWWKGRRQTLAPGSGSGSAPAKKRNRSTAGMQSLTAMRLKQR